MNTDVAMYRYGLASRVRFDTEPRSTVEHMLYNSPENIVWVGMAGYIEHQPSWVEARFRLNSWPDYCGGYIISSPQVEIRTCGTGWNALPDDYRFPMVDWNPSIMGRPAPYYMTFGYLRHYMSEFPDMNEALDVPNNVKRGTVLACMYKIMQKNMVGILCDGRKRWCSTMDLTHGKIEQTLSGLEGEGVAINPCSIIMCENSPDNGLSDNFSINSSYNFLYSLSNKCETVQNANTGSEITHRTVDVHRAEMTNELSIMPHLTVDDRAQRKRWVTCCPNRLFGNG